MELQRRTFLAAGAAATAAGVAGLAGGRPASADPALDPAGVDTDGAGSAAVEGAGALGTHTQLLSGADAAHPVTWEFLCTAGRNPDVWSTIPVPSHWEFHGFGTYTTGWTLVPEERGLYRHTFSVPADWAGRRTYIVFEGAMTDTTVSINGQQAGPTHQGGFYRFRYDVTELLRFGGENLLEATVLRDSTDDTVNRAEREGDYWNFGGIYRPVYLQSYPAQHIDRVAIDAKADGRITVDAFVGGRTDADRVVATVVTLDGTVVGNPMSTPLVAGAESVRLSGSVSGVRPWSAETPNLYRLDVRLYVGDQEVHRTTQRFGFRTFERRLGDGIYVNGQKIKLKGACRHIVWPDSGRAVTPEISRMDIELMKQMNMNAVRCSHYPPDTYFLDLCDELGLYVIDELAGWQKPYSEAQAVPKVKSMVTRDVNHPSVLFWANGNEGGHQYAVDDDYALYDPQNRTVIHPINWDQAFNGIKTHHYENYAATIAEVANPTIFMPTEFLHGLYDGGAGAGLSDFWDIMGEAPRCAGGFIWALLDEGIRRDDKGGMIDVNPNYYPDGILGPYRQKEASFWTIRDVWAPIQLVDRRYFERAFPSGFTGAVRIRNRFDFVNTRQCRFSWQLINFDRPDSPPRHGEAAGHSIAARADITSPDIAPGGSGALQLRLPTSWRHNDALVLIAKDPSGTEVNRWTWPIATAADVARRIVPDGGGGRRVTATEDAAGITLTAAGTRVTIDRATGRLARVEIGGKPVSLSNGPSLATGTATLASLSSGPEGNGYAVSASYTGDLTTVRWMLHPSGWLQLDYAYHLTGEHDYFGVSFAYPESKVTGVTWLGRGPYRVWKNRTRGFDLNVWSKAYNDTATGADTWIYPEFKGYHASTYWATLQTTEVPITVVAQDEQLFLRLFTPRWGWGAQTAVAPFPAGDISFMDAIPAMGTKFDPAANLGPESQPNVATGDYRRTLYFRFGS